ncbi:hypothetical protein [Rhodopseudomonas palustris]|uniref:Uncharacterized protein n=1 Tax=Rhodopseudomonas palustris (strain BisB18) TaxID=316056 RepID=Q21AZ7_RHOPB
MIDVADFQDLLDRLGEDLSSWPMPQREAAAALLRESDQARARLDEAKLLRRALAAKPVRASAALTDRIMLAIQPAPPAADAAPPPPPLRHSRG